MIPFLATKGTLVHSQRSSGQNAAKKLLGLLDFWSLKLSRWTLGFFQLFERAKRFCSAGAANLPDPRLLRRQTASSPSMRSDGWAALGGTRCNVHCSRGLRTLLAALWSTRNSQWSGLADGLTKLSLWTGFAFFGRRALRFVPLLYMNLRRTIPFADRFNCECEVVCEVSRQYQSSPYARHGSWLPESKPLPWSKVPRFVTMPTNPK